MFLKNFLLNLNYIKYNNNISDVQIRYLVLPPFQRVNTKTQWVNNLFGKCSNTDLSNLSYIRMISDTSRTLLRFAPVSRHLFVDDHLFVNDHSRFFVDDFSRLFVDDFSYCTLPRGDWSIRNCS